MLTQGPRTTSTVIDAISYQLKPQSQKMRFAERLVQGPKVDAGFRVSGDTDDGF